MDTSIAVTTERVGEGTAALLESRTVARERLLPRLPRHAPDGDLFCTTSNDVTWVCYFYGEPLGTTRDHSFVVANPPPGATYRIGVGTNWADDPEFGDIFVFSPSVSAPR